MRPFVDTTARHRCMLCICGVENQNNQQQVFERGRVKGEG
jgi:hypothetical protein